MVEPSGQDRVSLKGKTVYVPLMSEEGARLTAAAFRSCGVDGRACPESDARSQELAARHLVGEECYPAQVTLGSFLKVIESPGFDPERTGFFMPSSEGPCRFGQYATLFKKIFRDLGHHDVLILSPSSRYGYQETRELGVSFERTAWRALVAADILRKLRLMTRPYEAVAGTTDRLVDEALSDCEAVLSREDLNHGQRLKALVAAMTSARDKLRGVERRREDRPLIGVVGEIFCRLNEFSNGYVLRKVEAFGGEAWLSDITEWIHYTRFFRQDLAKELGGQGGARLVKMKLSSFIQKNDEKALQAPFKADFAGREEPHDLAEFLDLAEPYLPYRGSLGEMTLSVAKAVYLHGKGVDAILDISPFTCMNGIVSEAIYPRLSREHDEIPIRNLYFDGTETKLDRDLGMFLDLARAYRRRRRLAVGA